MTYQLGRGGLSKFKKMKGALCNGSKPNYIDAANEMLDSKWAKKQTPRRAKELADRMRASCLSTKP